MCPLQLRQASSERERVLSEELTRALDRLEGMADEMEATALIRASADASTRELRHELAAAAEREARLEAELRTARAGELRASMKMDKVGKGKATALFVLGSDLIYSLTLGDDLIDCPGWSPPRCGQGDAHKPRVAPR